MFDSQRRTRRRVVAPLILFVLMLAAAACASATGGTPSSTGGKTVNGPFVESVLGLASPSASPAAAASATGSQTVGQTNGDTSAAFSLQAQMVAVIKQVNPSVVQIETDSGLGSGIIYDNKGDIVTNAHVVGSSKTFKVTLENGKTYPATLVGTYVPDDIAVIKISATDLTPAVFGDSSKLSVGDFVLAIGNPLGLQSSVTEGIVSALGRQVSEPNGNALPDVIQTSAAINPGNSGGALVDLQGHVVGIPTLSAGDPQLGGSAPGIGFAISSNRARVIADQLIASGKVTSSGKAYLGIQLGDTRQGVAVSDVIAGGPAAKAGLQVGDLILSVDGLAIPDSSTLLETIAGHHPGDVVAVQVQQQGGSKTTLNVTLGEYPG